MAPRSFVFPPVRGLARGAMVVLACTGASELLAPHVDVANIIMVYLAGVAYVAAQEGLRVSAATAVSGVLLFDLLFIEPRWGLNPLNPRHYFTFAVMLGVGLLISQLSSAARSQRELAERRARRAQALAALAADLVRSRTSQEVGQRLSAAVQQALGRAAQVVPVPPEGGDVAALRALGPAPDGPWLVLPGPPLSAEAQDLLDGLAGQAVLALERCAAEQQTAQARVEAESERLRSTLLSGISHDFRTPLTTIVGAATSLVEQEPRLAPAARRELAASVLHQARQLHARMSDLLDLLRMEEGATGVRAEWCPADELVAEAVSQLGARAATHPLQVSVPPGAVVWCDTRLVVQALGNLLDNALRHTPTGTPVRVQVQVDGTAWTLAVEDDGPGLPAGQEHAVFRKFHHGSAAAAAGGGFGLGLALCAAVARLHGGQAQAQPGARGTRIVLRLPQPGGAPQFAGVPA